ncbi:MAG: 7,8-didemethyl-8-hydroxy-5-deazariboflavin synthase CofG [Myxococcota bacterium]
MPASLPQILARGACAPLRERDALALAELSAGDVPALCEAAAARRDRAYGRRLTFSPKVFLPLTNLCRSACDYCSFRRVPGQAGAWTMSPAQVEDWLARGQAQGATEALLCLGDRPEAAFASYRRQLASFGHQSTVDYLVWACERAIERGLLPHTNAGVLRRHEMQKLRPVNVSMGLMLENISSRLCERGMPHHRAPDKRPAVRVRTTREAGELAIPWTSGILVGIGETRRERVDSLLAIRALHEEHGHVQEVIVQGFRRNAGSAMANAPEPAEVEIVHALALARLILPDEVSVQAPPNLNPESIAGLIGAGLDDFGGISAVTPDYINPGHPWPHLDELYERCAARGFVLTSRLPIKDRLIASGRFLDPRLEPTVAAQRQRCERVSHPRELAPPGSSRAPLFPTRSLVGGHGPRSGHPVSSAAVRSVPSVLCVPSVPSGGDRT